MNKRVVDIFVELGRRMYTHPEAETPLRVMEGSRPFAADGVVAARNIARDMLTREALTHWLALYPALPVARPRNVLIITAGNIPFVGVHDLLCVLAAGHRAIVKPSSRDSGNMSWIVARLLGIDPALPVSVLHDPPRGVDCDPERGADFDAVIAMGSDDTVAALRQKFAGLPMLLRGNRSSAAVLSGDETGAELSGLADDALMFSGLGCRSVSLVFVPRGYDFEPLRRTLAARETELEERRRNNLRHTRAMLRLSGVEHLDAGSALLVGSREFPASPSVLNFSFYDSPAEVSEWLAAHESEIQCIASNSPLSTPHPPVPLGMTQHPGLTDYPDGLDTMKFLETI